MMNGFLERIGAACAISLTRYDGVEPAETAEFAGLTAGIPLAGESVQQRREAFGASVTCTLASAAVSDREDALDLTVTLAVESGETAEATLAAEIQFSGWSADNYVLVPGSIYAGNRFKSLPVPYPPIYENDEDIGPDMPVTVTDIPRLSLEPSCRSGFELTTLDPATPAIGVYFPARKAGFWLLTEQLTACGPGGISLEENEARDEAALRLSAPGVRRRSPEPDQGRRFRAGDTATLRIRIYVFACGSIQGLFDRFADVRKDLADGSKPSNALPMSAAWRIQEQKYNRQNWEAREGYYAVGIRDNRYQDWQPGWTGGGISSYPLLMRGNHESREQAKRTLDFLFMTQRESGFFPGIVYQGEEYGDGFHREDSDRWHLIRKSGDVLYYVMKQIRLLERQEGEGSVPTAWLYGIRRLADAFVGLWRKYGQFGQFIDVNTGEILAGGSTSGAIIPAGLMLASDYFGEERYRAVAYASAERYYLLDAQSCVTTGGPGEILQCPDSESAFALLESFVVLAEVTGDPVWVKRASEMANQCMTWCVSYDYAWPEGSEFGRLGLHSRGSVIANAQNRHSSPGICTLSGDALFKLYRMTGDHRYLELCAEIAVGLPQYLSRTDRPIYSWDEGPALPPGWMCERVNLSDWEGKDKIGGVFSGTCWCEISLMLTYVELPGLYVRTDLGSVTVFDGIDANTVSASEGTLTVKVCNSSAFRADVTIGADDEQSLRRPIGPLGCGEGPVMSLEPGESRLVRISMAPDGRPRLDELE